MVQMKLYVVMVASVSVVAHRWLFNTWNMVSVIEEVNYLKLNGHMLLVASLLEGEMLELIQVNTL